MEHRGVFIGKGCLLTAFQVNLSVSFWRVTRSFLVSKFRSAALPPHFHLQISIRL